MGCGGKAERGVSTRGEAAAAAASHDFTARVLLASLRGVDGDTNVQSGNELQLTAEKRGR